jgi:formate dehydrogenase major subunit
VRSAHIEASHHLPLRPGTNVAVLTALAHVIVTEGLFDEAFIRERCDWSEFEDWASFVADPAHSPEATEIYTGVPAEELRGAARLYARGGNGAIYYGLGVTEHSQGSTTVMAIANLAMATGNIGRPGVGVNPLRGQNNVQGACDMGSFPHELPGYRHISGTEVRDVFEKPLGRGAQSRAGPAHSQHARRRRRRHLPRHLHPGRGHPAVRSRHQARQGGLAAMECVVVHDLFLNETANYAHVFLPGSTFLEKDGTFTNAERRINRVRRVMTPKNGLPTGK